MIRKKNNSTTKLKKKKTKKKLAQAILRPLACEAETKPLRHCEENIFVFQILPTKTKQISTNLTSEL